MKHDSEDRFLFRFPEPEDLAGTAPAGAIRSDGYRVALIGCFPPRRCGIATFTADVHDHLRLARSEIGLDVYAMRANPGEDSEDATFHIDEDDAASYRAAARAINGSGAAAVWLQHEFGIFGGPAGAMLLELIDRIAAPLIVTLHTVLAEPTDAQRRVMEHVVARASRLVVMNDQGRQTLIDVYRTPPDRIAVIEHGAPDRAFIAASPLRSARGLGARPVLSTFGLLGQGKGLETAIHALPAIAARYPDILYRIVGATHPKLLAKEGEAYRESLAALAESLGVSANIAWENRFLDKDELLDQIELCDIYLAPYPNLAQVTSGTLAYAVALGRAVVSTPFVHARELLADDVGILVPQGDSQAIADAVLALLASPSDLHALQQRAYRRGRRTIWSRISEKNAALVEAVRIDPDDAATRSVGAAPPPGGVWAMCDDVGILQHGCGPVPDRDHGYCIDDNARALMLVHGAAFETREAYERRVLCFAAFIQHGWNPDAGAFRNFMGYDRRWLEERGSDDSNGRALWALGHCAAHGRSAELREWGRRWFDRTLHATAEVRSPRAVAFTMLGADELLACWPDHREARSTIERGGAFLQDLHGRFRGPDWNWFEPSLAYDNARLSEAMIRAGRRLDRAPWVQTGLDTLEWLSGQQTSQGGYFRPVGSEGFGRAGEIWPFDQQPLEAWATVDACGAACRMTGNAVWRQRAEAAYRWFLGRNDRGAVLGSGRTGRCQDGLTPRGVNANVGAESTLAFHLAYQGLRRLFGTNGAGEEANFVDADLPT